MGGRVDPGGANEGDLPLLVDEDFARLSPPMPRGKVPGHFDMQPMGMDGETSTDLSALDMYRHSDSMMPSSPSSDVPRFLPRSPPPKTPIIEGNAKTNPPSRGPKTALALHFARAMGYEVPGTPDSPDELAFAKAAHSALLKMTKGMTVAKLLSAHQSAKTRDAFGRLLDQELAKDRSQSNQPVVNTPAPLSMRSRPPLQPI